MKMHCRTRGSKVFKWESKGGRLYSISKGDLFLSKSVDKRLMIYVAVKTHSPKILMVNETEIGGLVLCLKCVYACVLLLHFVEECRHSILFWEKNYA